MQLQPAIAQKKPHFSIPSIIAIACAVASFFVRPATGVILAIIAIIFGVIGVLLSFAPSVRGGMVSFFSLIVAPIAIVVAIIREIAG